MKEAAFSPDCVSLEIGRPVKATSLCVAAVVSGRNLVCGLSVVSGSGDWRGGSRSR